MSHLLEQSNREKDKMSQAVFQYERCTLNLSLRNSELSSEYASLVEYTKLMSDRVLNLEDDFNISTLDDYLNQQFINNAQ
jgi:hypothetical protein